VKSGILKLTDTVYVTGAGDPLTPLSVYWEFLKNLTVIVPDNPPSVILHTNGLLLDEIRWNQLGDTRPLISQINVSFDAASQYTYKINRGGSWSKLLDNMKFAASLKRKLVLYFVVQANNYREFPEFVRIANSLGATSAEILGLENWLTYSKEDYAVRAVHAKTHPLNDDFREVLKEALAADVGHIVKPFVMLGDSNSAWVG
jgi:MoaA/NifB/PqqE/SkfB family radical SAM enzyme